MAADDEAREAAWRDVEALEHGMPARRIAFDLTWNAAVAHERGKGLVAGGESQSVRALDEWRQKDPQKRQWVTGSRFGQVMVSLQCQGEQLAVYFGGTEAEARAAAAEALSSNDPAYQLYLRSREVWFRTRNRFRFDAWLRLHGLAILWPASGDAWGTFTVGTPHSAMYRRLFDEGSKP